MGGRRQRNRMCEGRGNVGKRQIIDRCTNFKINGPYLLSMLHQKSCILVFSGVGVLAKGIHCVRHKLLDGRLQ